MSKPYENSGDYCGYPIYTDEQVDGYVQQALDEHRQLLVHCNGDAASQQMLNGYHHSRQKTTDTRPVMVHSQTLRPDQLPQLKETGVMPSYFLTAEESKILYEYVISLNNQNKPKGKK